MHHLHHGSRTRRLLAVALSLVLMITSFMSMHAHAGHGIDHHAVAKTDRHVTVAALASDPFVSTDTGDHGTGGHDHGTCADMVCHGGIAVVAPVCVMVMPLRSSAAWTWISQSVGDACMSSLERPPRVLVRT